VQEASQLQQMNDREKAELEQKQLAEKRSTPKSLKAESKTRTAMFKKSLRISSALTPEQELEKIKQVQITTIIIIIIHHLCLCPFALFF